ncbi:MAG: biotin/lipoyl-containing protein [Pseudomonadota bacterium]
MTRSFKITVDGTTYDVQVDEVGGGQSAAPVAPALAAPPVAAAAAPAAPAAAPAPASPAPAPAAAAGAGDITSPLAGTVVEVHVKAGDSVTEGQTVVTLEAMKMNTAITAPRAGTVTSVPVNAGMGVEEGQLLVALT